MSWDPVDKEAVAQFAFEAGGDGQLSLKAGDRVKVHFQCEGWFKGTLMAPGGADGIFPTAYVKFEEEAEPEAAAPTPAAAAATAATATPAAEAAATPAAATVAPAEEEPKKEAEPVPAAAAEPVAAEPVAAAEPVVTAEPVAAEPVAVSSSSSSSSSSSIAPPPAPFKGTAGVATARGTDSGTGAPVVASTPAGGSSSTTATASSPSSSPSPAGTAGGGATTATAAATPAAANSATPAAAAGSAPGAAVPAQAFPGASVLEHGSSGAAANLSEADTRVTSEINNVIRDWGQKMKDYHDAQRMSEFEFVKEQVQKLVECRRALMNAAATEDERTVLRKKVYDLLEEGRRTMGLDMLPRVASGNVADEDNTGIVGLYHLHCEMRRRHESRMGADAAGAAAPAGSDRKAALKNKMKALRRNSIREQLAERERAGKASTKTIPDGNIQLVVDLKATIFLVGDPTEMHVALYCAARNEFVSESYIVPLTGMGTPENPDDIGKLRTVFKDLSQMDFSSGLHVVCRVVRRGKMMAEEKEAKKQKNADVFRRPFGCAVFPVSMLVAAEHIDTGRELCPENLELYAPNQDTLFPTLHELIINRASGSYAPVPKAKGIAIGVTIYSGDLPAVLEANASLAALKVTGKLGFPEVILPGDTRNDLYVTIEGGEFLQDRKKSAKNIEATMCVIDSKGAIIRDCISLGSMASEHRTMVYYHQNAPRWSETLHLCLTPAQIEQASLVFCFAHCSTKSKKDVPFSFAVFGLVDDAGIVQKDQSYSPTVYAFTEETLDKQIELYIAHQRDGASDPKNAKIRPRKETFNMRTLLCSTKLTQNAMLHSLLKWQTVKGNMEEVLKKFTYIEQFEVVKFVREIFDALFSILSKYRKRQSIVEEEISTLVYNALVFIIGILVDSKFNNFKPILESYIAHHFHEPNAYFILLHCLRTYLQKPDDPTYASHIRASMKAIKYIFRFIIASRLTSQGERDAAAAGTAGAGPSAEADAAAFREEMSALLGTIDALMNRPSPEWVIGAQIITLKSFGSIFEDLEAVYGLDELAGVARSFIASVHMSTKKRQLNIEKLGLIRAIVRGDIFRRTTSRKIIAAELVGQVQQHLLRSSEETVHSISVVTEMMDTIQSPAVALAPQEPSSSPRGLSKLQSQSSDSTYDPASLTSPRPSLGRSSTSQGPLPAEDIIIPFTMNFLGPLPDLAEVTVDAVVASDTKDDHRDACVTSVLAIVRNLPDGAIKDHLLSIEAGEDGGAASGERGVAVSSLLRLADVLVGGGVFPDGWIVMNMVMYKVVVALLREVSGALLDASAAAVSSSSAGDDLVTGGGAGGASIAEPATADLRSWKIFFAVAFRVMEAPALQLESLGTYKAEFVRPRYGDLRREVAALVRLVWDRLGSQQSRFVEDLVGPVAALMISHSEDVKSTAMSLFFALLQSEFAAEGNFHNVERRTIDALNQRPELVKSPEFKNTFTSALEGMFNGCGDEQLKAQGLTFLGDIKDLLEMMVALQGYPALPEYEDERTSAALKLMSYLRQTDRTELYTTYVDLLVGMHKDLGNMVEAGMAVMLKLEAARSRAAPFPEIERLYESAISHLSEGKDWEMAIRLCRELGNLYETSTYDYNRLADVLVREAELFRKIPSEDRFFAEYFRVGFWGRGFPAEYANKEFVYKGSELERVGDFAARIQAKFPKAEMVKKSERPPAEIRDGDGQHLQISTVLPSSVGEREGNPVPVDPRMPKRIQKYRSHNGINMFLHSRSIRKEKKGDNEFKSVWVMNAFLETEDHFPGVRRRSLIIGSTEIELSPIDNAINVIESKNDQLIALVATHQALVDAGTPPTNINEFTMVLNGVIDAAVNGGILKYSDAFFNEDFAREQPDKAPQIARLKAALNAQLDNTGVGLQLHRVLCSEEMIKLQEHLESSFAKMRAELADVLK